MKIPQNPKPPITKKQQNFIQLIADRLGLNLHRKNKHIISIIGREIHDVGDLTIHEATVVIDRMLEWERNLK